MAANAQLRQKLAALIQQGQLPASQCSKAFLKWIAPLLSSQVVRDVRSERGAGRRLLVVDVLAVQHFYQREFPFEETQAEFGSRVAGIAQFRDTKALANDTPEFVMMRVAASSPIKFDGGAIDPADITREHGVFSFPLSNSSAPSILGQWIMIENPAVFQQHHRIFGSNASAILANGRISNRLLNWISAQEPSGLGVIHAPDYDPTGLSEFLRIHERLNGRVSLHIP